MYFVGHTKKRMLLEQGYDNNKKVSKSPHFKCDDIWLDTK